jgi:hypothetical protein
LMSYFEALHLVNNLQKLPNRLADPSQEL